MAVTIDGSANTVTADATLTTKLTTATGSAPSYSARAWAVWNGASAATILASGNVSSIADGGVGIATVNFITNMPDVNYVVAGTVPRVGDIGTVVLGATGLVNSVIIRTYAGSGGTLLDFVSTSMVVLR